MAARQDPVRITVPVPPLQYALDNHGEVRFLLSNRRSLGQEYNNIPEYACQFELEGVRLPGVVFTRINPNAPTSISREVAERLGLDTQLLGGSGLTTIAGGYSPVAILRNEVVINSLGTDGAVIRTFRAPLVFVCNCTPDLFEFQIGWDVLGQEGATSLSYDSTGSTVDFRGGPTWAPPLLFPRRNAAMGTSTFNLANDTAQEAARVAAERAAARAAQPVVLRHAVEVNGDVRFSEAGREPRGPEYCSINEIPCQLVRHGVRLPGVVRARVNPGAPTSMSREVAELLGLEVQPVGGPGAFVFSMTPTPMPILKDELVIECLDNRGRVERTFRAPVVFVCPCEADLFEFQIGTDVLNAAGMTTLEIAWDGVAVGFRGGPIWRPPRLYPRRSTVIGTSTFQIATETRQAALQAADARGPEREHIEIAIPQPPLRYLRATDGEVRFLVSGRLGPEHAHRRLEFPCQLVYGEGVVRRSGVVRTQIHRNGPTAISREVVELLGLEAQQLGGGGAASAPGSRAPISILKEPLGLECMDMRGEVVRTLAAPLVFVTDSGAGGFEFQIGADVLQAEGATLEWDVRSSTYDVRMDFTRGPAWQAPALLPRPGGPPAGNASRPFRVPQDTYREAMELVAARAAVRARREAARRGNDPRVAGERAAEQVLGRLDGASAAPGRVGLIAAGDEESGTQQSLPERRRQPSGAVATGGLQPGSREWVEDWLPAQFRRLDVAGGGGRRRRQGRGRGRGRGGRGPAQRGGRQQAAEQAEEEEEATEGNAGEAAAGGAAGPNRVPGDLAAGLAPLPPPLAARAWSEVEATHLPAGDKECPVCMEELTTAPRVVQLACRHTFCELCVRQVLVGSSLAISCKCPTCRSPMAA